MRKTPLITCSQTSFLPSFEPGSTHVSNPPSLSLIPFNLLAGNASIEEDQGEVAILFLDICDFDEILNDKQTSPIKWIDDLYRYFDKICVEYGVQKIEVTTHLPRHN